jgi:hypothetical protein
VLSGVKEGEQVVVSDRSALKAGTKVRTHEVQSIQYQDEGNNQNNQP